MVPKNSLQIGQSNQKPVGKVAKTWDEVAAELDSLSDWSDVRVESALSGESKPTLSIHSDNRKLKIHSLSGNSGNVELEVSNALIFNASLSSRSLVYRSCKILNLNIRQDSHHVDIIDCSIGVLNLPAASDRMQIRIERCNVCQLQVPPKFEAKNLKISRCSFSGTYEKFRSQNNIQQGDLARNLPMLDRQSFSNLQNWATKVGNSEVAHIARGNELKIETVEANGIERAFLLIWKFLGNYGLSPARPLVILLVLTAALFAVLLCQGTVVFDPEFKTGWQSTLIDGVGSDNAYKSAVATLNNLISPWSFLSPRRVVQPATPLGIVAMGIHSAFTVILVLLTGFSLRRRFRFS